MYLSPQRATGEWRLAKFVSLNLGSVKVQTHKKYINKASNQWPETTLHVKKKLT